MVSTHRVTIAVVAHNEEATIGRCLKSLLTLPACEEILVLDNQSTDQTASRVTEFFARYPDLKGRLITLDENHLGKARAHAILAARGPWVAFLDADCEAPAGWLEGLARALSEIQARDPSAAAVGSGNIARAVTSWGQTLRLLLASRWGGLGTIQATPRPELCEVEHLPTCNILYDRTLVLEAGNFSHRFSRVCEDLELSHRLRSAGGSLYFVPDLSVLHEHGTPLSWARKMFRYGWGQMRVAGLYPGHLLGVKGLPIAALMATAILFATSPRSAIAALTLYVFAVFAYSFFLVRQERAPLRIWPRLMFAFVTTHGLYATGEACGLPFLFRSWLALIATRGSAPEDTGHEQVS